MWLVLTNTIDKGPPPHANDASMFNDQRTAEAEGHLGRDLVSETLEVAIHSFHRSDPASKCIFSENLDRRLTILEND